MLNMGKSELCLGFEGTKAEDVLVTYNLKGTACHPGSGR